MVKIDMTWQLNIEDDGDASMVTSWNGGWPAYTMSNENGGVSGCYVMLTQQLNIEND